MIGFLVQTWNPQLGPRFEQGTHNWVVGSNKDPQLGPWFRPGTFCCIESVISQPKYCH